MYPASAWIFWPCSDSMNSMNSLVAFGCGPFFTMATVPNVSRQQPQPLYGRALAGAECGVVVEDAQHQRILTSNILIEHDALIAWNVGDPLFGEFG